METPTRTKDTEQQYQADVDPTLDSLQLLLREAGRFQLLTPAEDPGARRGRRWVIHVTRAS